MIKELRKCDCCGELFYEIPLTAKFKDESFAPFNGFWWDCSCKSTMFMPTARVPDWQIGWLIERFGILGDVARIAELEAI